MKNLIWKIYNSLWITPALLFFVPYMSGLSFIYARFRVKKKLWIFSGIFISIIAFLSMYFEYNGTLGEIWFYLRIFAMFYVFIVLYEYLIRLDAIEEHQEKFEWKIFREYRINPENIVNNETKNYKKIILKSLWIIPSFIPVFNGLSFI